MEVAERYYIPLSFPGSVSPRPSLGSRPHVVWPRTRTPALPALPALQSPAQHAGATLPPAEDAIVRSFGGLLESWF